MYVGIIVSFIFVIILTVLLKKGSIWAFKRYGIKLWFLSALPLSAFIVAVLLVFNGITTLTYENMLFASNLQGSLDLKKDIDKFKISDLANNIPEDTLKPEDLILIDKFVTPRFTDKSNSSNVSIELATHFIYKHDDKMIDYLMLVTGSKVVGVFVLPLTTEELADFRTKKISNIDDEVSSIKGAIFKFKIVAFIVVILNFLSAYFVFNKAIRSMNNESV